MPDVPKEWSDDAAPAFDFVLVGAGAGGAPLAARLAERGYSVLVCEMGPERPTTPATAVVENTEVPLLHGEVTEDRRHALTFFVNHYGDPAAGPLDPKWHTPQAGSPADRASDETGVFYPRAQGVGGCTVHNAMITVSGPSEDWDRIAEATGDESWRGERMRAYFERLEHCRYNRPSWLREKLKRWFGIRTGWEDDRHGSGGWLETTVADFGPLLRDRHLLKVVKNAVLGAFRGGIMTLHDLFRLTWLADKSLPNLDPNHWRRMREAEEGVARIPCAITDKGTRSGSRERLLGVKAGPHAARLTILSGVFVTRLEYAPDAADVPRVVGVRVIPREHLYEADPNAVRVPEFETKDGWQAAERVVYCRKEVVLCGGAFNTPQLLMLSGIGPQDQLDEYKIGVVKLLDGVGKNLQDRYEVPVVAHLRERFETLAGLGTTSLLPVAAKDPLLKQWVDNPDGPAAARGLYATNGGLIALLKRSGVEDSVPDLFIFALAGYFPGYHVGYSRPAAFAGRLTPAQAAVPLTPEERAREDEQVVSKPHQIITWVILKARTRHHGGEVRLRSASPFRRPLINFRSFPLGPDDLDARALAQGVRFVQDFTSHAVRTGLYERVECPGLPDGADDAEVNQWVRAVAWGHHACGTCRIGPEESGGVVDARLRVHGVAGLRVADASVFPRIPGVFIVTNVYMLAEKAADILTEDHPLPEDTLPAACRTAWAAAPVLRSRPEYEARRTYPTELEAAEAALVRARRVRAGLTKTSTTPGGGS
ncbi:MAG TPA: GMC family oxidoreductase [Urbifossiella sp.]|jgi:choline dehydrogenase|nr:GMC family oxidoreductase [Urbifossiella sp.]